MVQNILRGSKLNGSEPELVTVYCDSKASIAYTKYAKYHSKSKHIGTKYNFIKDIIVRKNGE